VRAVSRLCARPGCSNVAATAYGFDADRLLVWLAVRDPDGDPLTAGALCSRHADAMVVPRGWTLDDRRRPTTTVTDPAAGAAATDPDATDAIPWVPEFDHSDDLGGVLAVESPLLARAFRGTDRPR